MLLLLFAPFLASAYSVNVSTGLNNAGLPVTIGSTDNWALVSAPVGVPLVNKATNPHPYWQPTPIAGTNAQWVNHAGSMYVTPGVYVLERSINVPSGTGTITTNFGMAVDDTLLNLELIPPTGPAIPLSLIATTYSVSTPIVQTFPVTAANTGVWRIRATVQFIDGLGAFILSGYVDLNECSCSNLSAAFTQSVDNSNIATVTAPTLPGCLSSVQYSWYVDGSFAGSGSSYSFPVVPGTTYTVTLVISGVMPDGSICSAASCSSVYKESCTCDSVTASFTYALTDNCMAIFTGNHGNSTCFREVIYEWWVNGSIVAATDPGTPFVLYISPESVYHVCLMVHAVLPDGTKCDREFCQTIVVNDCSQVSTDPKNAGKSMAGPKAQMTVFPNPAENVLSVGYDAEHEGEVSIVITTPDGKELMRETRVADQGHNVFTCDISKTVANGIVMVHLEQGTTRHTEKVIIQH